MSSASQPSLEGTEYYKAGRGLLNQRKHSEAEGQLRQAVDRGERTLGRHHRDTIRSKYWLGLSIFVQEKYSEAEELLQQAAEWQEASLRKDHEDTLNSMCWLGLALYSQKKYNKAEELLQQVADRQDKAFNDNHESTLYTKQWLGLALHHQNKYDKAQEILQQAADKQERMLGIDHEDTLYTKYWLGLALYYQKKHNKAEELLQQVADRQEKILGKDHQETLNSKYWLRRALYSQKKYRNTERPIREKASDGQEKSLGTHRKETLASVHSLEPLQKNPQFLPTDGAIQQTLSNRLNHFFSERQDSREPYTDSEINEISTLLKQLHTRWSNFPRAYIVIRTINHLDLLDRLIDEGFSDFWFPVTESDLPDCLHPSVRVLFVQAQSLIFTKSMDLEKHGQHYSYNQEESLPFESKEKLGSGASGQFDRVTNLINFREYTRKRIYRLSSLPRQRTDVIESFIAEIRILKRLRHRHIVELVGSYTDPIYLALVMSPVAEMNLAHYLQRATTSNHSELRTFFGCLATTLEYIHKHNIQHRGIEPSNIYISYGKVLFANFGPSLDSTYASSSTIGMTNEMNPRYYTPEPQNTMSDIWSLGVCFMEMIVVLKGMTMKDMNGFLGQHGSKQTYIHKNLGALQEFVAELEGIGNSFDNQAFDWTRQMLSIEQKLRPTASSLVVSILAADAKRKSVKFCGMCCAPYKERFFGWVEDSKFPLGINQPNSISDRASISLPNEQYEQTPTDSSYVSRSYGQSVRIQSSTGKNLEVITEDTEHTREDSAIVESQSLVDKQDVQPSGLYSTETIYSKSETSTLPPPRYKDYIVDLATELFSTVNSCEPNRESLERIGEMLPDLLRAFALKIGHKAETSMQRDVSYFVHKHRSSVQQSFEDLFPIQEIAPLDRVKPGEFAISRYLAANDSHIWDGDVDDVVTFVSCDEPVPTEPSEEAVDEPELSYDPSLYRDFITKSPAFSWLVTSLQREATLTRATPDVMETIRDSVLSILPSTHKVSRRESSVEYKIVLELDWDPLIFLEEQQYTEKPDKALKRAITLTGSKNDAQALTASEYLSQTWPATGEFVMDLVVGVVHNLTTRHATCQLPDGTEVTAWIEGNKFQVIATGTGDSLAEIVQQFAWLGAALRTSPSELGNGIAMCVPYVKDAHLKEDSFSAASTGPVEMFCAIGFKISEPVASTDRSPGQCWHDMFRNPVMVNGYPTLNKREHGVGLEMPLNMIAGLAGSERAVEFNGNVFIKGFSTMLVATKLIGDLIVWHYIFNSRGERVSYLDYTLQDTHVSLPQLDTSRHVVGWSPDCQYYAGAKDAQYKIDRTGLPRPHPGAFLEKVTISAGKIITGGAVFAIGVNNVPTHLVRHGYIPKLMWMNTKHVIFWDELDKRGWLVNGTSALLHLVRASLKHYSTSAFSSVLMFDSEKMVDVASRKPESAVAVLIDPNNRELEIWPGKNEVSKEEEIKMKSGEINSEEYKSWKKKQGFTLFEDLVDQQYTALELIMEHHKHLAGQNGINLKLRARKHLEGWDFKELATGYDPCPRVATLQALGYGWVDFVRSIGAVTLFGRGFGDIIRPFQFDGMCPQWRTLPSHKYHLAASMFDLNKIMEIFGCSAAGPLEPVEGLLWHSPDRLFARCYCQGQNIRQTLTRVLRSHHDPVQVFYPKRSRLILKAERPDGLCNSGAIIFGHNVSWPYRWRERLTKDVNVEEEDLEEGPPLVIIHEPKALNAPLESIWESTSSDVGPSATSESTHKNKSETEDMSHSLHSAYTTITTPVESTRSPADKPATGTQEYMDNDLRWVEQDQFTVVTPTTIDNRVRRETSKNSTKLEHYTVLDRHSVPPPRKASSQKDVSAQRITSGQKTFAVEQSPRMLRREKRRI